MSAAFHGDEFSSSPMDEFLAHFFGTGPPRRGVQRVDITRPMSGPAREPARLSAMMLDGVILPGQRVTVAAGDAGLTFRVAERQPQP